VKLEKLNRGIIKANKKLCKVERKLEKEVEAKNAYLKSIITKIATILLSLRLPIFVFLACQFFLVLILKHEYQDYLRSSTWIRWDSGYYIQIAENSYEYFSCAGHFGYPINAPQMCGNAGWFPGYPLIIKLFSVLPFSAYDVSPWVSRLMFFMSLILFSKVANVSKLSFKNIVFMLIPAFWFGHIYFNNTFPNSTVLFFMLLAFYSYLNEKKWILYFSCIMASMSYPTGILVSGVVTITMFLSSDEKLLKRGKTMLPAVFGFVGLALFFAYLQYDVGDWSAFLDIQKKYNHGIYNPLLNIGVKFSGFSFDFSDGKNSILMQSALILLLYFITTAYFFIRKLYRIKLFLLSYIFFTVYLVFPWVVGGDISMYRSEAILLPACLLYKDVNTKINLIFVAVLIAQGAMMGHWFFNNVLR
jgi:hypothetical protein